jgi:mannose-6-phosphate isomerase-like protein (cupin superfamily)
MAKYIKKPWGSETIWANTEHYVGKIIFVNAGEALSIQYHNEKDETMYVQSGIGTLYFYSMDVDGKLHITETIGMTGGKSVHIPPKTIHRLKAATDLTVLEVSTNHLDDIVRLEDRYNRI